MGHDCPVIDEGNRSMKDGSGHEVGASCLEKWLGRRAKGKWVSDSQSETCRVVRLNVTTKRRIKRTWNDRRPIW